MLNGIAPLLLFRFFSGSLVNTIQGIPNIGDFIVTGLGAPISLYLDETITGIYVESEAKAIDIETSVQARNDSKKPIVDQRGLNSITTVNILASRDSTFLSVLLALNDMVFSRVVSKEYNVSYFNGPTLILNGLLHGFSTNAGNDDNLVRCQMQLSRANQESTQPQSQVPSLDKVTGTTPFGG